MGWHHRKGNRVRLVYRSPLAPHRGHEGIVVVRPGRGKGPRNFLVALDSGITVVVPGGNMRGA